MTSTKPTDRGLHTIKGGSIPRTTLKIPMPPGAKPPPPAPTSIKAIPENHKGK
jgi:hypothetical protein